MDKPDETNDMSELFRDRERATVNSPLDFKVTEDTIKRHNAQDSAMRWIVNTHHVHICGSAAGVIGPDNVTVRRRFHFPETDRWTF